MKRKSWQTFEQAVAALQADLAPDATVSHNEILVDRHGHKRQFDVVLRARIGNHSVLGVIECKDTAKPVGTPAIDAFVTKSEGIKANLKCIVSRRGFTQPARELATHHGVRILSLLRGENETIGVEVGDFVYCTLFQWARVRVEIVHSNRDEITAVQHLEQAEVQGHSLLSAVKHFLYGRFNELSQIGWHEVDVCLPSPVIVLHDSTATATSVLRIHAYRSSRVKRKAAFTRGRGMIDYQTQLLHVAANDSIQTTIVLNSNFDDWEDFASEAPPPTPLSRFSLRAFFVPEQVKSPPFVLNEMITFKHRAPND